jgi:hypothetical protein
MKARLRLNSYPVAITGITAIAACRVMLGIAQMVIHLALQGALDDHLGQPAEQTALASQLQAVRPGPLGELPHQLLIGRRQLHAGLVTVLSHVSHLVSPPGSEVTPLKLQSRLCSSDLAFQATSCCRHLSLHRVRTFALGSGVLGAASGEEVANADISGTRAEHEQRNLSANPNAI